MKKITYEDYLDKTYGGWFGKCLGGAAGAPVEGIKGNIDVSMRDIMDPNIPNDDLDIQLLWLELLEEKGPYFDSFDMALKWEKQCWYPFGEYGIFLKNFERRIAPPYSGKFNNQYFFEGMGCPIRSEIWGMVNPGRPQKACEMAAMDGSLDHYGNSVWAEIFLAALESMAYFESDITVLINKSLEYVNEDCKFRSCIEMIMKSHKEGASFETIVRKIQMDYSHPDFTNSVQNLGYTVLALLFCENDMEKAVTLALRCGYDTDCTCATAGAVIGIINGYKSIPEDIKELLHDKFVCGIDVVRQDNLISTLAKDTCNVGAAFSEIFNDVSIVDCDDIKTAFKWKGSDSIIDLSIKYLNEPAIMFSKPCELEILLRNNSDDEVIGILSLKDIPKDWESDIREIKVSVKPHETVHVRSSFNIKENAEILNQKNIIKAVFTRDGLVETIKEFGIAGSISWMVSGPHIEARYFTPKEGLPFCHGSPESLLPPVETMFSNDADPDKEFLDEKILSSEEMEFPCERIIESVEDLIPVDDNFGIHGEATFYLKTYLVFPEDLKTWVVVGNSDAYKLWINGEEIQKVNESRTWQPQAHADVISLKKGINSITLKLTKRSENLKFSLGFSGNDQKHYHAQKWISDFACIKK